MHVTASCGRLPMMFCRWFKRDHHLITYECVLPLNPRSIAVAMLPQTQWTLYWFFATYAGELQGYCMTASSFTACMVAALSHTWWPLVILATKDALQMIKTKPPSDCVQMCLAEWMWHNFCGACSRAGWREPSCDCLQIMRVCLFATCDDFTPNTRYSMHCTWYEDFLLTVKILCLFVCCMLWLTCKYSLYNALCMIWGFSSDMKSEGCWSRHRFVEHVWTPTVLLLPFAVCWAFSTTAVELH